MALAFIYLNSHLLRQCSSCTKASMITSDTSPWHIPSTGSPQTRFVKNRSDRTALSFPGGLISTTSGIKVFVDRILNVIGCFRHRKYSTTMCLKYLSLE